MKFLLIVIFQLIIFQQVIAQTDTSFWFVAPDITSEHGDKPIYLRITALNENATVTITQPANNSFTPIIVNVSANTSQSVELTSFLSALENLPENVVLNKGLFIRSTKFVTVYYEESSNNNPEIFVLKGRNALGTNFFIPSQNLMNNDWMRFSLLPKNGFDIVATEDNTVITITPAKDIIGHSALQAFSITLNKGQTYSAVAVSNLATNHLMGTTVIATKPIAITIKDDSIRDGGYNACADLAGEQIVPINMIGKKYISLPGYLNQPNTQPTDNIFVLATEDNTVLSFNGTVSATLNMGQTFLKPSYNNVFYIEATKPVYVLHLSGFGCEVGTALLPQLECSGSKTVGFTRSTANALYLNILVPSGGEANFSFNGSSSVIQANLFNDVPTTNGAWKYARILINTNILNVGTAGIVKNSTHDFHLGIIHGDEQLGCRYGYFSGFNRFDAVSLSNSTIQNPVCSGDTLRLFCDVGSAENISYSWTGPNSFSSNEKNPIITNAQVLHSGTYTVTASKLNCNTIISSTQVLIKQSPLANAIINTPICESQTLYLNAAHAGLGANYLWLGPNNFNSNKQTDSIVNTTTSASGNYILQVTNNNCTVSDTVAITINQIPLLQLTSNSPVCNLQELKINCSNTVPNTNYLWTGPNSYTSNLKDISIANFTSPNVGTYYCSATANNCTASNSIDIALKQSPVILFDTLKNICKNDAPFSLFASEISGIVGDESFWVDTTLIATNIFYPANFSAGLHKVKYMFTASNGCINYKEQPITIYPIPTINIQANKIIVEGNSVILKTNIAGNVERVLWSPNFNLFYDTLVSPVAKPNKTTLYKIDVTSKEGCKNSDTVTITVLKRIVIPNAFSPNNDGVNDTWEIKNLEFFNNSIVEIFDRNGHCIFRTIRNTKKWDGTYKNKIVPVGVYYYIINLNDGFSQQYSGSVTLLR